MPQISPSNHVLHTQAQPIVGNPSAAQQIPLDPATFRGNAPHRRPQQRPATPAGILSPTRAAPAVLLPTRVAHSPPSENLQWQPAAPRSIGLSIPPFDEQLVHNQGKKLADVRSMIFNHHFRVEAKDFAVSINDSDTVKLT